MLRRFSSAPAISLLAWLLWAHTLGVAIAEQTVDDADLTYITYSDGWVQCSISASPMCMDMYGQPDAKSGTWHTGTGGSGLEEDLNFNFTFTGTSVELWFILAPGGADREENKLINLSVDQEEYKPVRPLQDSEPPSMYHSRAFGVKTLLNQVHTIRVNLLKGSTLLFDFLVYENEDPNGSTNGTGAIFDGTLVMSSSTNANGGTSTASIGSAPSPSSLALGHLVGGIVSGISVFILVIAGILWYRFKKNSRKGKPQCTAPLMAKLPPEPAPPKHKTMSTVTYDPPGYTEKNAYFGIQSLADSGSIGPTPEKGPLLP